MLINTISEFRVATRHSFVWPGGYPTYFLCDDGEGLCHSCVSKNRRTILDSIANKHNDGWRVVALDINYEDQDLVCANCNQQIEPAYFDGDPR